MKWSGLIFATVVAVAATSCMPALSAEGAKITRVSAPPSPTCQNLGTVVGRFATSRRESPEFRSERLIEYATIKATNQAAELGATHVQPCPAAVEWVALSTAMATVTATAYRCAAQ